MVVGIAVVGCIENAPNIGLVYIMIDNINRMTNMDGQGEKIIGRGKCYKNLNGRPGILVGFPVAHPWNTPLA